MKNFLLMIKRTLNPSDVKAIKKVETVSPEEIDSERETYGRLMGLRTPYPGEIADVIAQLDSASASAALYQDDGL